MATKKATRPKTTTKTSSRRRSKLQEEDYIPTSFESSNDYAPEKKRSFKKYLIIGGVILLLGALLYFGKSLFIAAIVNGQPIYRLSVIERLEKQGGKQTLQSLVTQRLILQEAQKMGITVDKSEIDREIKQIEENLAKQNQKLDEALASQGMTRDELREQIKTRKIIEKILAKNINVTDKEIDAYIAQNKDSLAMSSSSANLRDNIKKQLAQEKLSQEFQKWIAEKEKSASIMYFHSY